jgi:hypothetical protein
LPAAVEGVRDSRERDHEEQRCKGDDASIPQRPASEDADNECEDGND